MAADPIVGAWELVSDSRVAIAIFTGSHYAFVGAPKDRRPSAGRVTINLGLVGISSSLVRSYRIRISISSMATSGLIGSG